MPFGLPENMPWWDVVRQFTDRPEGIDPMRKELLLNFLTSHPAISRIFTPGIHQESGEASRHKGLLTQLLETPTRQMGELSPEEKMQRSKIAPTYEALLSTSHYHPSGSLSSAVKPEEFLKVILGEKKPETALMENWPGMEVPNITPENLGSVLPVFKKLNVMAGGEQQGTLRKSARERAMKGPGFLGGLMKYAIQNAPSLLSMLKGPKNVGWDWLEEEYPMGDYYNYGGWYG